MGLLSLGTPLDWEECKKLAEHVREHGIDQFLSIWRNTKDKEGDTLLWGDEVEYIVVSYDDDEKDARLSLRQAEILKTLADDEALKRAGGVIPEQQEQSSVSPAEILPTFHAEYGRYMLEATPGAPYNCSLKDLLTVEPNMKRRRVIAKAHMKENESPITLTSYPRLGCERFTDPYYPPTGAASRSLFLPDEIINPHPRFPTLTANIRSRRTEKVAMNVPIFFDENTPRPFVDPTIPRDRDLFPEDANAREGAAKVDHIYMDSMGFGMGCCCLQITFQAKNVVEARRLYDQLTPLGPIMLAMTAAAPLWRGYVSDQDCRWNVIAGSVDDRPPEERGEGSLKNSRFRIPKSRYDSVDCYISQDERLRPEYNDVPLVKDEAIRQRLLDEGIDKRLADHVSHLFIRDPLVIFSELIDQDDTVSSDHFENIWSTNWQTMRFKPPPPGSDIGWRVEFRSMEIQITDFENAAFSIFIVLLTRAILSFGLNFYIPISKVDENMQVAHHRGAILTEKFWFRKNVFPTTGSCSTRAPYINGDKPSRPGSPGAPTLGPVEDEYERMTINEIMNGKGDYPGLLPLVETYLNSINCDVETRCELNKYLALIRKRASGELQTAATWIREFVRNHPAYKKDSVVSREINYDLIKAVEKITNGEGREEGLGREMLGF
ncbi:glutamate--cysteine ligase [Saitoella coloradoensis]